MANTKRLSAAAALTSTILSPRNGIVSAVTASSCKNTTTTITSTTATTRTEYNHNNYYSIQRIGLPLLVLYAFCHTGWIISQQQEQRNNNNNGVGMNINNHDEYIQILTKITNSFLAQSNDQQQQTQEQQQQTQGQQPVVKILSKQDSDINHRQKLQAAIDESIEEVLSNIKDEEVMRDKNTQHDSDNNYNSMIISANYEKLSWPPLEALIDEHNSIIGDVSFLLDFAILGFPKCGTSTMMFWLGNHTSEIQCFQKEKRHLLHRKPSQLVQSIYTDLLHGLQYKRGYKNPVDIGIIHILDYLRTLFHKTKLIVGLRHPVSWFESMYNFRVQNLAGKRMPKTANLIGGCYKGTMGCCTSRANYAYALIRLGKQFLTIKNHTKTTNDNNSDHHQQQPEQLEINRREPTPLEDEIVWKIERHGYNLSEIEPVPNPLFLFDTGQLSDKNTTRVDQFRKDVGTFLNLKYPLGPLIHYKPGKVHTPLLQAEIDKLKIDICDDEHIAVRNELMRLAKTSSLWIRTSLLDSPTIYVSSKEYFVSLLENWMIDPCDTVHNNPTTSTAI